MAAKTKKAEAARPAGKKSNKGAAPSDQTPSNPGNGGEIHQQAASDDTLLTTNQGVPVGDNQNSLKAGARGPVLLQDFILREKIMHFDHERIPERVVHARGSAAHGFFECLEPLGDITRAAFLQKKGDRIPVFTRFSTVAGNKGSSDLARDVRGFAVKFYTQEGNFDLVGNNIPVFFIQDAIKFPDLIHAAKQDPDREFPQAQTAHDTFWDFISLTPESMHMIMWIMSDRAIPRSCRMMEGFGVHTFRLVNAKGQSTFVKFHWRPKLGTQSVVWDEAVKINGADPDFHRRDLWNAIDKGDFPEFEFCLQTFTQRQADKFDFDVLDATKLIPEEMIPLRVVGRMVLDRNPANFFAETEQVAFCAANVVPGIDFTNDPLLQGRLFSYQDTQLKRLGGPNFHQIPINQPKCPFHNLQRDGHMQMAVPPGQVNYEPSSLGPDIKHESQERGYTSFAAPEEGEQLRIRPESFADHYSQARLFFASQTEPEQNHIVSALVFELSKCLVPRVREAVLSRLIHIDENLAMRVAAGLGDCRDHRRRSSRRAAGHEALARAQHPGQGSSKPAGPQGRLPGHRRHRRCAVEWPQEGCGGARAPSLRSWRPRSAASPRPAASCPSRSQGRRRPFRPVRCRRHHSLPRRRRQAGHPGGSGQFPARRLWPSEGHRLHAHRRAAAGQGRHAGSQSGQ